MYMICLTLDIEYLYFSKRLLCKSHDRYAWQIYNCVEILIQKNIVCLINVNVIY